MSDIRPKIAVFGATGKLGGLVAKKLAQQGIEQSLIVRDPQRAPRLPNSVVRVGDYADPASLSSVLEGAETVFMVSLPESVERLNLHQAMIDACAVAGVSRVVYTSFLGAAPLATFTFAREHSATERSIVDAGLSLTALRNSLYADVLPFFVGSDGVLRGPAGNGRVSVVTRNDIARLGAAVLVDDSHAGFTYDVTGPEAIDLDEVTRLLSLSLGRPITYFAETEEEARASRVGHEPYLVDGWVGSYLAIASGELSVVSHTIEHVTGEVPMPFSRYLASVSAG